MILVLRVLGSLYNLDNLKTLKRLLEAVKTTPNKQNARTIRSRKQQKHCMLTVFRLQFEALFGYMWFVRWRKSARNCCYLCQQNGAVERTGWLLHRRSKKSNNWDDTFWIFGMNPRLYVNVHHVAFDAASLQIFERDLWSFYNRPGAERRGGSTQNGGWALWAQWQRERWRMEVSKVRKDVEHLKVGMCVENGWFLGGDNHFEACMFVFLDVRMTLFLPPKLLMSSGRFQGCSFHLELPRGAQQTCRLRRKLPGAARVARMAEAWNCTEFAVSWLCLRWVLNIFWALLEGLSETFGDNLFILWPRCYWQPTGPCWGDSANRRSWLWESLCRRGGGVLLKNHVLMQLEGTATRAQKTWSAALWTLRWSEWCC